MKRILSILLSVSLVATLLISMSVTSFAVQLENETNANIEIAIEEADAEEAFTDFFDAASGESVEDASNRLEIADCPVYKVTLTIKDLGLNCIYDTTAQTYSGRFLVAASLTLKMTNIVYDDENSIAVVALDNVNKSPNVAGYVPRAADVTTAMVGEDVTAQIMIDKNKQQNKLSNCYPYKSKSTIDSPVDPYYEFYIWAKDSSFDISITDAIIEVYYNTGKANTHVFSKADNTTDDYNVWNINADEIDLVDPTDESTDTWSFVDGELQAGGSSEPVTHAFTVYAEDGSVLASADVEEGAAIEMPTAPAVTGKTFSHWSLTEGGAEVEPETVMGTEDLVYYAVYTANKYTITYVIDGAETTKEVEYGQATDYTGDTPAKEGYTFTGWDKPFAPATEDTTYTAQFAIKTYDITFVVNGQSTTKKVNHNETPDFGSTPSKDGYNFIGWSLTDGGAIIEIPTATGAATYYAVFEPKAPTTYTITFVVDGQDDVVITVNEGTKPAYPNGTPSKAGHTFMGWDSEIVEAIANATYTAVFVKNPDAVTMNAPVYINGTNGNILPEGADSVEVEEFTVLASELLRVHTKFEYNSEYGTLAEMGMLFVPKAVAGAMSQDEIIAAGITKDACCKDIANLTGNTNVTFKAGLVGVPKKGIEIYAIPYYKLSTGGRIYQTMQTITFE